MNMVMVMVRMPGSRPSQRGSRARSAVLAGLGWKFWLYTAAILIAGGALFLFVVQISVAGAFRSSAPRLALNWAPADADARANTAARILSLDRSPPARARAEALAREALDRDITRVAAVHSLALGRIEPGRPPVEAARLMDLAQRLTRRDRGTQMWLANEAARRRDPRALIRHFDFALRTTSRGRETLLASLVAAARDPVIAGAIDQVLRSKPNWWLNFIAATIDTGTPEQIVQFAHGRLNPALEGERAMMRSAIEGLVRRDSFDGAWQIYSEAIGREDSARLRIPVRNGGFEQEPYFAPFEWMLVSSAERQGSREPRPDGTGMSLRVTAGTDVPGDAATQLVRLSPGVYRLRFDMGSVPADLVRRPRLLLRCAEGGAVIASVTPETAGDGPFMLQTRVLIPAGCPWQWLAVQSSGSASEIDPGSWIDNVMITRL